MLNLLVPAASRLSLARSARACPAPRAGFCHVHLQETFARVVALTNRAAQKEFRGTPGMAPAPATKLGAISRTKDPTERIEQ